MGRHIWDWIFILNAKLSGEIKNALVYVNTVVHLVLKYKNSSISVTLITLFKKKIGLWLGKDQFQVALENYVYYVYLNRFSPCFYQNQQLTVQVGCQFFSYKAFWNFWANYFWLCNLLEIKRVNNIWGTTSISVLRLVYSDNVFVSRQMLDYSGC